MKLHRKVKDNEKVCHAHDLGFYAQGQGRNQVKGQNLHRKIEHEKVCRTQELGSHAQGQGHNQAKGQIVFEIMLLINY